MISIKSLGVKSNLKGTGISIDSVIGKNILGGASIKLVNSDPTKSNQQITCSSGISELIGYNADGTSVLNGSDCDVSNTGFEILPNSNWKLVVQNSIATNSFVATSTGSLSTTCDAIANCAGKECGSNGCGGFCENGSGNNQEDCKVEEINVLGQTIKKFTYPIFYIQLCHILGTCLSSS